MNYKLPKKFVEHKNKVPEVADLREMWDFNKKEYGEQKYFSYKKDKAVVTLTYNDMHETIQKIGTAFYKIGVMGENIAIITETRYEWLACYMATVNGNGIVVPLDKELTEEQILNFLERAKVTCVAYSASFAKLMESYAENTGRPDKKAKVFINLDLEPEKEELPEDQDYRMYSFETLLRIGEEALNENCAAFKDVIIDREKP